MAEESNQEKVFPWIMARDGSILEIYSNFVHVSWTLYDMRVRFGQLIPAEDATADDKQFVVEERGAVTFSWHQAKNIRDILSDLIDSYEKANGPIKPLKLPLDPTVNTPKSETE